MVNVTAVHVCGMNLQQYLSGDSGAALDTSPSSGKYIRGFLHVCRHGHTAKSHMTQIRVVHEVHGRKGQCGHQLSCTATMLWRVKAPSKALPSTAVVYTCSVCAAAFWHSRPYLV